MEERFICPKCGHTFEQGEYNYNYDTALLDFSCPECDWEGTDKQVIDADDFERNFSLQFNNDITIKKNIIMTNRDYVNEYYRTIANLNSELEKRARKEIMEFDKEIDIRAIKAYDLNIDDKEDEEVLDAACGDCEWGMVETRHGENINCAILGVRYNKDKHIIEAFMTDGGEDLIDEWININYLSIDVKMSVYVTILEFIDQAKELCS